MALIRNNVLNPDIGKSLGVHVITQSEKQKIIKNNIILE